MNNQNDPIQDELDAIEWQYADKDLSAINELTKRIEETGRIFGLISYTDLVNGVIFNYSNINGGKGYHINIYDWSGLDRRIIGDCLGYISWKSYTEANFMASALVIGRMESKPSEIFFNWMVDLGVLQDNNEDTVLAYWSQQVKKAHQWYKYGRII